jgi:hypothetical protein
MHDARISYAQYVTIGYRLLGPYLDKAYNSVPGGVGPTPLMAFLTGYGPSAFTKRLPAGVHGMMSINGGVLISLRRAANGHISTLDSGGVLALHT